MKQIFTLAILFSFFNVVLAQEKTETEQELSPKAKKQREAVKRQMDKPPYKFNPSIGAGVGVTRYFGDIEDVNATNIHRLGNRIGYDFTFKTNISRAFNVSINSIFGKISGNENEHRQHRNFEAKFFSLGLNLEYNFRHFYKNKRGLPFITPFLSAGAYYADYNPRADLYDGNGNLYYYWTDGFIRNQPEATSNPDEVKLMERDYEYETHLTEYPVTTVAFPVAGGFDFHLGPRFTFRVSASYFFTLSDKLDNYYEKPASKKNDGYYYNSIAVFFNILSNREPKIPGLDPDFYFFDFGEMDKEDTDGDGIPDIKDKCANTPSAAKVDEIGCPVDTDGDGIPDYLDKEPNSAPGAVVDGNGVTLNFMQIAERAGDTLSMARKDVTDRIVFTPKSKESQYTIHVATLNVNAPPHLKTKLEKLKNLVATRQDSMMVYTLGEFSDFKEAEAKQKELLENGYLDAFVATPKAVDAIALELEKRMKSEQAKHKGAKQAIAIALPPNQDVVKFSVQLQEYRLRLQVDKLADLMARDGVELKTTIGGLKIYTIGAYDSYEQAEKIRKEIMGFGVKQAEIIASINNKTVSVDEAKQFLKKQKK